MLGHTGISEAPISAYPGEFNRLVTPTTLALTLTTFAPFISRVFTPTTLALTLATFAPAVTTGKLMTPSTLALTLTTFAPTINTPRVVTPPTTALVLATFAPLALTPRLMTPTTLALTLTTFAPTTTGIIRFKNFVDEGVSGDVWVRDRTDLVAGGGWESLSAAVADEAFVRGGNSWGANVRIGTNDNYNVVVETNGTDRLEISTATITSTMPVVIATSDVSQFGLLISQVGSSPANIKLDGTASDSLFSPGALNLWNANGANAVNVTKVNTTNATATLIDNLTTSANSSYLLHLRVTGRRTGGAAGAAGDSATYVLNARIKNVAGTVTIHDFTSDYVSEDQAGWDVSLTVNGTAIDIKVTGAASNNVAWFMAKHYVEAVT